MAIEHTHTQQESDLLHSRQLGEKRGATRKVWRRLGAEQDTVLDSPNSLCNGPFAQAGVRLPPKPAARSTHSIAIQTSETTDVHTTIMEQAPFKNHDQRAYHTTTEEQDRQTSQMDKSRKLKVTIPEELLSTLRTNCAAKAAVSLLGRVQGKHPGLKSLTTWAKETLHPSLTLLSLKANNLFEVTFDSEEGRIHALRQADLKCESTTIFFASWRPHFDARAPQAIAKLDCPVWVQVVDLCQILREETFLRTIGEQLGQVIAIDTSDAYKAKLLGPRIRLLVQDLNNLPQSIVIPRMDGEGEVEYELEFSGLPNQCGRCRAKDHQVRNCPKNEPERSRKGTRNRQRTSKRARSEQNLSAEPQQSPPGSTEKGEDATRNQAATKTEKLARGAPREQGTFQRMDPQERRPTKEQLSYNAEERTPPRSTPSYAEITQATAPIPQVTQVSPPLPMQTATCTVIQDLHQDPEAEKSTAASKKGAVGEWIPRTPGTSQVQEPGGESPTPQAKEKLAIPVQPVSGTADQDLPQESEAEKTTSSNEKDATGEGKSPPRGTEQETGGALPTFLPDDVHFPRLQTPMRHSPSDKGREGLNSPSAQPPMPPVREKSGTTAFVWGPKPVKERVSQPDETQTDKGKSKSRPSTTKAMESAPITRQGYRSGRLAEDFWSALGIPSPPSAPRKTL